MDRYIVTTNESVWLVEMGEVTGYVIARASFGQHMPNGHDYHGRLLEGPDGAAMPKVGHRLVFNCRCDGDHTGWGETLVQSGTITGVYPHVGAR